MSQGIPPVSRSGHSHFDIDIDLSKGVGKDPRGVYRGGLRHSPAEAATGTAQGCPFFLENQNYSHNYSQLEEPKTEEWLLVSDDILWYFESLNTEKQKERQFFKDVAKELRFCFEKLTEIKSAYVDDGLHGCQSLGQVSNLSSPISFCSQNSFSIDNEFYDLPDLLDLSDRFEVQLTPSSPFAETSNTSFVTISPLECHFSSFEDRNITNNEITATVSPVANNDHPKPLSTLDLLAPYSNDVDEEMFFTLIQDFSLDSPHWRENSFTNGAQESELVDRQPHRIPPDNEHQNTFPATIDSHDLITISCDIDGDVDSTDGAEGIQQYWEKNQKGDHSKLDHYTVHPAAEVDEYRPSQTNESKGQYENLPVPLSLSEDTFTTPQKSTISSTTQRPPNLAQGEGTRTQVRWWSASVDKIDLQYLKVPTVPATGLVFNANQDGAVKVGEGSFGTVFLADLYAGPVVYKVVVKDFSPKGVTKPEEILEEARVLMHLSDTMFIPHFYGLLPVATSQRYAIVQQYFAQGMSLHNIMEDKSHRLSQVSWINMCVQLAVGLDMFHQKGILMNDIKRDNILVDCTTEECVLKYIDMGLASFKTGRVFYGSEDYMQQFSHLAPEVRRLDRTSPASDVYSLGKILMSIVKYGHLGCIKEFVSPCLSQCPVNRPNLQEIVCNLLGIRDQIYNTCPPVFFGPFSARRWFC